MSAQTTQHHTTARRVSTETKASFKTTELIAYVVAVIGVLVASAVADEASDFGTQEAWFYITLLTIGYMVSRGLAKSGSRDFYDDNYDDNNRTRWARSTFVPWLKRSGWSQQPSPTSLWRQRAEPVDLVHESAGDRPLPPAVGRFHPRQHTTGGLMFFFFSNRLGCGGSLLLSLAITAVLLLVFFR